jgi:hypothetical protein
MFDLAVHLLRFRAEVTSPLRLPPAAGAALRGALFGTLRAQFCAVGGGPTCGQPPAAAGCPVCYLLAPTQPGRHGGQDVPRPYVLRVPLDAPRAYASGQPFEFTLATFGGALGVFPYALLGVQEMGQRGLGVGRAGSFRLTEVWAENPLAGRQERIFRAADGTVATPALPIDAAQITAEAGALAARLATPAPSLSAQRPPAIRLALRTPTRLVESGRLVKPAHFELATLLARLLERLDALGALYGAGPTGVEPAALRAQAERVRVVEQQLVWRDLFRGSSRHGRQLPLGGLVGEVVLDGDLAPLLPWLLWGMLVHVGKDAAMGNGRLAINAVEADARPLAVTSSPGVP